MENGFNESDPRLLLKVAVVAQGYQCLSMMRMLNGFNPGRIRIQLIAIATIYQSMACTKFAGETGVTVYENPLDLFTEDHLDLIFEMTGDSAILEKLVKNKPPSIGVLDRQASMLILDIAGLYQRVSEKESEISLATSFASALLEASPDAVMVIDRDFKVINCNTSDILTGGKGREAAIGKTCYGAIHGNIVKCGDRELRCPMEEMLKTGKPARTVHETVYKGQTRVYQSTCYPLANPLGEIVQAVIVMRDITADVTERVEQRAQAIKTDLERFAREDRLASLGRLVASVCHEINNPITSILTFNKLILRSLREEGTPKDDMASFARYLDISVQEAMRCGQIVKNLLTFARQKTVEISKVDLHEMIKTIMVITDHQLEMSNVAYEIKLPNPPFETEGDNMQIQQCLMNLIFNAIEAMPEGGQLTITGGRSDADQNVWLTVADTGIGIDGDDLPWIFEPFYTTKKIGKGVGLGLSMVHGIVSQHNGSIEVESEVGKGSVFKLTLPTGNGSAATKRGETHDTVDANTCG